MPDSSRIGEPRVDEANQCVWWGDRRVDLLPKAFLVLQRLMQQPNQIVKKNDLLDAAWPDTHVTEGVLKFAINHLREALADDARQPRFIETVHRRGYRWIGDGTRRQARGAREEDSDTGASSLTPHSSSTLQCVGRDAALAQLEQAFARAANGARQMVFVSGEAGIGKTALIDEFVSSLVARPSSLVRNSPEAGPHASNERRATGDVLLARGQCVDGYGTSEAFMPLLEAVERLCRESSTDATLDLLRRLAPTWLLQLPRFLKPGEQDELRRVLAGSGGDRMVRELGSFVDELTLDQVLVLTLEDLHWSDHATVGALAALAARRDAARLLVIASYRPADAIAHQHPITKLKHELAARGRCIEIALHGLTPDAVDIYVARRFPKHRLPPELAPQLQAQTSGNPLFMLNALDDFVRRGWLEERGGTWECTVDLATLAGAVPEGTRQMIGFRLQQLSPPDLALLEAASVIGVSFATQALAAVVERPAAEIEVECARLARAGQFIVEGRRSSWPDGSAGMEHAFSHALYRQVLYEAVTPARRHLLHQRIAARLEGGFAGDVGAIAPQLARHFERGGDLGRAVKYRKRAARLALDRFAYPQAIEHLHAAVALLERMPAGSERDAQELTIQSSLLEPYYVVAGMAAPELLQVSERIAAISSRGPTSPGLFQGLAVLIPFHATRGAMGPARAAAEQLVERAMDFGPSSPAVTIANGMLGFCQLMQGEVAGALERLEKSMDLPEITGAGMLDAATVAMADAAFAHCLLGNGARSRELQSAADARAEASKHPPTICCIAANAIRTGASLLDDEVAQRGVTRLASLAESFVPHWRPWLEIGRGWLAIRRGEDGGVERIQRARAHMLAAGYRGFQPGFAAMAATGLVRLGRMEEAEALLVEALALTGETEERSWDAELHRLRGEARRADLSRQRRGTKRWRETVAAAEVHFEGSMEIARRQGARLWQLRTAVSWATLLRDCDRVAEAREVLRGVYDEFPEESELPDLSAAEELLSED